MLHDLSDRPWQKKKKKNSIDLFEFNNFNYVVTVKFFSIFC